MGHDNVQQGETQLDNNYTKQYKSRFKKGPNLYTFNGMHARNGYLEFAWVQF